ncbi:hypothetical protein C8R44DRAFT_885373 [Mycena epipterygia]|nr:hypothetical protein C8R44DRAFT_885373 [Mycena epipterygia]
MPEQITLYTSKVELALAEAKVDYTRVEIDLKNKPRVVCLESGSRQGGPRYCLLSLRVTSWAFKALQTAAALPRQTSPDPEGFPLAGLWRLMEV